MDKKKTSALSNTVTIFIGGLVTLLLLNILFLLLISNERKTVMLLKTQLAQLEQDSAILASSEEVSQTYTEEAELLSKVFPNEETILQFLQSLESITRESSDEYSVKFTSFNPLAEQDKLYLVLSVFMRSDRVRFLNYLSLVEQLPYMTQVTNMVTQTPDGLDGKIEVSLIMKVYVQNPFAAK